MVPRMECGSWGEMQYLGWEAELGEGCSITVMQYLEGMQFLVGNNEVFSLGMGCPMEMWYYGQCSHPSRCPWLDPMPKASCALVA